MYTCIKLFFESIFMICHAWTLDVTQESNKPVLGRLTANICIPSEKEPLASEILGVFELDLVARLRSEGSQVYWKSNILVYGISNRIRHCVSLRTCQLKYLIVNEFSQTLTKCYTHKSCFDIINSFNLECIKTSKHINSLKIIIFCFTLASLYVSIANRS